MIFLHRFSYDFKSFNIVLIYLLADSSLFISLFRPDIDLK